MKLLSAIFALFLLNVSAPAQAVQGGSDEFLWSIVLESDFCLVYIAGGEQGMERCTGTKEDAIDGFRDYEGGEPGDGNDDDSDE